MTLLFCFLLLLFDPAWSHAQTARLAPHFADEVHAAGLAGRPFAWGADGAISFGDALRPIERAAIGALVRDHNTNDPVKIAADALSSAKNSCGTVAKAKRFKDGVVEALCSSGARFLVFTMKGETMTKRCLPARALGIHGC